MAEEVFARQGYSGAHLQPIAEREGVDRGEFRRLSSRHFFQSLLGMTLFHYASGPFGAAVLGTGDLFTRENVGWHRTELRTLLLRSVLAGPED